MNHKEMRRWVGVSLLCMVALGCGSSAGGGPSRTAGGSSPGGAAGSDVSSAGSGGASGAGGSAVDQGGAGGLGMGGSGSGGGSAQCPREPENTLAACSDGCSNDGDPYIDCDDRDCCSVRTDCPATTYCGRQTTQPTVLENTAVACSNGVDDDGDGTTDCNDVDCCGVVSCALGTGCNPGCYKGIAELWSSTPTQAPNSTTLKTTNDYAGSGWFELDGDGLSILWRPQPSVPYTTDCTAVDQFSRDLKCTVTVNSQQWASATSDCGWIRGTLNMDYQDGSGVSYRMVFSSTLGMTEAQSVAP